MNVSKTKAVCLESNKGSNGLRTFLNRISLEVFLLYRYNTMRSSLHRSERVQSSIIPIWFNSTNDCHPFGLFLSVGNQRIEIDSRTPIVGVDDLGILARMLTAGLFDINDLTSCVAYFQADI